MDALVARSLKKNPNERFPSAEAMRDECLRVAASLTAAAPSIVPGARTSDARRRELRGLPAVDRATPPPPGPVQTPYQPGPYGTPSPAYSYPQQGGYQAPPQTAAYAPQQSASTPPPYNLSPHSGAPGGGSGGQKGGRA